VIQIGAERVSFDRLVQIRARCREQADTCVRTVIVPAKGLVSENPRQRGLFLQPELTDLDEKERGLSSE
jgi:hypothetical protein